MGTMFKNPKCKRILCLMLSFIIIFNLGVFDLSGQSVKAETITDTSRPLTLYDIPDAILYNKLKGLADINKDLILTVGEMESYTGDSNGILNLANMNITSVKGLGYAKGVKSIDLYGNNGINTIPENTFIDCKNLTSIKIPDTVISIGNSAFEGCTSLNSINLPNGLNSIGDKSFFECKNLKNITLPSGIAVIGSSAFAGSGLISIEIPNPDVKMGVSCFNGCGYLNDIKLPEGMLTIPMECFKATAVYNITIPTSIITIEEGAFSESKLLGIDLSKCTNLKSIKTSAFSSTLIMDVKLPESLTELGARAFENCSLLPEITLPSKIAVINELTFGGCSSLKNVIFTPYGSNYIQEIKARAFFGCSSLGNEYGNIEFLSGLSNLVTIGDEAFAYCSREVKTTKTDLNGKIIEELVKDEYGQQVYDGMQGITLPQSLSSIGKGAFSHCSNLRRISIPDQVTVLDERTFSDCYNLEVVDLSSNLTSVGARCFEKCRVLKNIVFPNSLKTIGDYAFLDCANEKYRIVDSSGTKIREYLYTGLETLELPDSITSMGVGAFKGCYNLNKVKLPAYITQISNSLFENCSIQLKAAADGKPIENFYRGIKVILIPTSVTSIGTFAFSGCNELNDVNYNALGNLKTMGRAAFKNTALQGIIRIPSNIKTIEESVFEGCRYITSVEFPDGLISIGKLSFKNCMSLISITIPAAATIVYSGTYTSFYGSNKFSNAIVKPVPADISIKENSENALPIKCFREIKSVVIENENIATARIAADSNQNPQVLVNGVSTGKTKVTIKGTIEYETGKDPSSGAATVNRFETMVEFNVEVSAIKCTGVKFEQPIRGLSYNNKNGMLLNPVITPADTTDIKIWKSDNESIARVDDSGRVFPVNYGTTTIRLKVGDQPEAQCQVNVCAPAGFITLDKSQETLMVGKSTALAAKVYYNSIYNDYKDNYPDIITWSSSNPQIATVDQDGNVKAVGYGEVVITAKADAGGGTATCKITVVPETTNVYFDKSEMTINKGDSGKITIKLNPSDSPLSKITVATSNYSVASYSVTNNIITVVGKLGGTAKITATPVSGQPAECLIKVNSPLLSLTAASPMTLNKGASRTISLVKEPLDATDKLLFISNNSSVATVDENGKVTAVGAGKAIITIKSENGLVSTTCEVEVKSPVTGVTLDRKSATMNLGDTLQLKATVLPSDATNKNVTWSSTNVNVAKVDENGNVTAVGKGTATIMVKSTGSYYYAHCYISVTAGPQGVTLDKTNVELKPGAAVQLKATITPDSVTDKRVSWTSSNTGVAIVDAYGRVTARAVGNAIITVRTLNGNKTATCTITVKDTTCIRISGDNRFTTAVKVSQSGWKTSDYVVLVNAFGFADALTGAPFAFIKNAPILLSEANNIPQATMSEIKRLNTKTVYILGGTGVVSSKVENMLKSQNIKVVRISGADRFGTALAISNEVLNVSSAKTAVVTTAFNYPDALAISPYAAMNKYPILYTEKIKLNAGTKKQLKAKGITKVIIPGGTGVVSTNVENELKSMGISVERIAGKDRYYTATNIANKYASSFNRDVMLATGCNFPDALAGGVLAAKKRIPILLVSGNTAVDSVRTYVKTKGSVNIYALGGSDVVSNNVVNSLK